MINFKIPAATTIPLSSVAGEEFYAVIIQEERNKRKWNAIWLFRKGCGVAHLCFEKIADKDDPTMIVDGALDATGKFDENKGMLQNWVSKVYTNYQLIKFQFIDLIMSILGS